MELRQLKHALNLAETKNFRLAAEKSFISQPALSRSIQKLEESLGSLLFDRNNKEISLTPAGKLFIEKATDLIQQSKQIKREISLLEGAEIGEIVIGSGPYVTATFISKLVSELTKMKPKLKIRLVMDNWQNLSELLLREKIDVFISDIRDLKIREEFEIELTQEHDGFAICRPHHPILSNDNITFRQLKNYPIAVTKMPKAMTALFEDFAFSVETDNIYLLKDMVKRSDLIAFASLPLVHHELQHDELKAIPIIDLPHLYTKCGIVTLKNRTPSPATSLFLDLFRDLDNDFLNLISDT